MQQMAEHWQDAASQQVELIAGRLNELLSAGLDLLHSELGVDLLGLKPVLIPPWVVFLAACLGLVLLVALWASACRGLFKKRPTVTSIDDEGVETPRAAVTQQVVKKKRKPTEKKSQSNGRAAAVAEVQEEEVSEDVLPHHHPADGQTEKVAEVKKIKKKPKAVVKDVKAVTTAGKEPEEDTWETKVSNKEKREQRRKDKPAGDGSGSPGGVEPSAPAPTAKVQKKKKGESSRTKAEKVDVVAPQVNSSEAVVETGSLSDPAVKSPSDTTGPDEEHLTATQTTSEKSNETSLWGLETDGSWTVIDAEPKTPDFLASFTELGVVTAAVEPQPTFVPSQPQVEDEWSGLNGGSGDPSSDWNAPAEVWGNYEEPLVETPPPAPEEEQLTEAIKGSDEEKDKADSATDGSGKSKKKKKKKKKQAEDAGVGQESEEPEGEVVAEKEAVVKKQPVQEAVPAVQTVKAPAERPQAVVQDKISQKALTQVPETPVETETSAKQNSLPSPTQKKAEESQPVKQVKKKKARRET